VTVTAHTVPAATTIPGPFEVFSGVRRVWVTAAICGLTLLGYFAFPGHTFLQSDTQIYVAILEHLRNPATLASDPVASHPHVAYTIFDEVSLVLRWLLHSGFEQALTVQQIAFRALGLLGVYWLAGAFGLSSRMAVLVTAIFSLGATVPGPAVLTVEYEAVPRGFAVCLLLLSLGLLAQQRIFGAAAAASLALLYHPPTVWPYWILFGPLLAWRAIRHIDFSGAARRGLALGVASFAGILMAARLQRGVIEPQVLFSLVTPAREELLRLRIPYIWISGWPNDVRLMYVVLWALAALAWFRLRRQGTRATDWMVLGLPLAGLISIPMSWAMLEKFHWAVAAQIQPARAALFIIAVAILLAAIAAVKALERGYPLESMLWFAVALAPAINTRVLELFRPNTAVLRQRLFLIAALSALAVVVVRAERWSRLWCAVGIAALSLVAARAIPEVGRVQNFSRPNNEYIENVALWAALGTPAGSMFHFPDAGHDLYPGVFRARSLRAVYIDWKGGGQMNFLPHLGDEWGARWHSVMTNQVGPAELAEYKKRGIDFVVLKADHRIRALQPAYQNGRFYVYRLHHDELVRNAPASTGYDADRRPASARKAWTSAREGTDAWAPMRVTEIAAAALAKRKASASCNSSAKATAKAALKVSPAAVESTAVTGNPGA
jgi:hypothetical protein